MTGGGFGGCNISIVKTDSVDKFIETVKKEYAEKIGYEPTFYLSKAGQGAGEIIL